MSAADDVRILATWQETPALVGVRLDLGAQAEQYKVCGQYLVVELDGKKGYYAFASRPGQNGREAELLIKPAGGVAAELTQKPAGTVLAGALVAGKGFPVDRAADKDVLLVGMGSGIAPLRAMLQHIASERSRYRTVTLLEGQRTERDFPFAKEHATWEAASIRVIPITSRPSDGYRGTIGRVQDLLSLALREADAPEVFLCGNREMVDDFRGRLAVEGIGNEHVHLNH